MELLLVLTFLALADPAFSQGLGDAATNDQMAALPLVQRGADHHYKLRAPGAFFVPITITNTCSWAQVVGLSDPVMEWRDTELQVPAGGSKLVYWGARLTPSLPVLGSLFGASKPGAPPPETKNRWAAAYARHAKSINPANGNICQAAQVNFGETVAIDDSPDTKIPARARLDEALELILVEVKAPPPTTVEPPKTTPAPKPDDQPVPGIGRDYPVIPIPGANDPKPAADPKPEEKPEPPKVTPFDDGVFFLYQGSQYSVRFDVINECDTPQRAYAYRPGGLLGPARDIGVTAPAHGKALLLYPISISAIMAPPTGIDSYTVEASGDGDASCIRASASTHVQIRWITSDPQSRLMREGTLGEPATLKLVPKPPTTTKNTGTDTRPEEPVPFVPGGGCGEDSGCIPFDRCGTGSCGDVATPAGPKEEGFQVLGAETLRIRIDVTIKKAERAMNPLGLLSKSVDEFINWWMPTLEAAEQNLQQGLQFLVTSAGGSTGKNMAMQVLNFTGKPVNLEGMLALEPLKKDAQQKATQAFAKLAGGHLPTKVDLNGYCFEFLKLPPIAGQIMRVAPPDVQKRFEPLKKVMAAANRLTQTGGLKPDSNPAAYADSIKQWAIWTVQEKFNQSTFADAFVNHTKKNVEAAGQKWSGQIEAAIRQAVPNRWNDITQILKLSGVPR